MDTKSTIQRISEEMDARTRVWGVLEALLDNYDMSGCLIAYDAATGDFRFVRSGFVQVIEEGLEPEAAFRGIGIHERVPSRGILFNEDGKASLVALGGSVDSFDQSMGSIFQVSAAQ